MKDFDLIKHIVDSEENSIVVWLFNIGTEKYWGDITSSVKHENENILVNHMEEMNLLITRKQDYIILRKIPEKVFLIAYQSKILRFPIYFVRRKKMRIIRYQNLFYKMNNCWNV